MAGAVTYQADDSDGAAGMTYGQCVAYRDNGTHRERNTRCTQPATHRLRHQDGTVLPCCWVHYTAGLNPNRVRPVRWLHTTARVLPRAGEK